MIIFKLINKLGYTHTQSCLFKPQWNSVESNFNRIVDLDLKVNKQVWVSFLAFDYLLLDFHHQNLEFSSRNRYHHVFRQNYA